MAKNRREIDKETMFNKIMPSGMIGGAKAEAPAQAEPEPPLPRATGSLVGEGVNFSEKNPAILINIMEYLVVEKLDAAFAKFNCCKCDKCKKDVAAIALNKLVPKYMVTEPDKVPVWVALQNNTDVTTAIVQGILQVRAHPRH